MTQIISTVIVGIISVFSIFTIAIILERAIFFSKNKINYSTYRKFLPGNVAELRNMIRSSSNKNPLEKLLTEIFDSSVKSKHELTERLDSVFTEIDIAYHKRIEALGIFARVSTLLGLFGTVIGMIGAFNEIVAKGTSNASIVAGGISGALITTAVGLAVAIPATFFHDYFSARIEKEIKNFELVISDTILCLLKASRKENEV